MGLTKTVIIVYNARVNTRKNFKIHFSVLRQVGTSLEDQLVSGFSAAIRSGAYVDGETLPGIRKLAVLFGVSIITVQNAVKKLCREGLLEARPRSGLRVCWRNGRSWRGMVLGVKAGPPGMYVANVIEDELGKFLRRSGWLYSSVSVSSENLREDLEMVKLLLKNPVSLVVTFHAMPEVSAVLEATGVPFIEVAPHCASEKAVFPIRHDLSLALVNLADALKTAGVKTVLSVYHHSSVSHRLADNLEKNGLKVRSLYVRPVGGHNTQECVQRAGLKVFEKILGEEGVREDAVVCNDDYLAAGVLLACARKGVRFPADMKFATFANKGLGPVFYKELDRIESDPAATGAAVGPAVVEFLERGRCPDRVAWHWDFIRGRTI